MEPYLVITLLILGGAAGVGGSWLYWRRQMRRLTEQSREAEEGARQSLKQMMENNRQLEDEVFAGKEFIDHQDGKLSAAAGQIASLAGELQNSNRQFREISQQIRDIEQQLHDSEMDLARIPGLESSLAQKEAELARRQQEIATLNREQSRLAAALAEEKRSLDECIIFVEGSHYLPGRVVRNLTGAKQP